MELSEKVANAYEAFKKKELVNDEQFITYFVVEDAILRECCFKCGQEFINWTHENRCPGCSAKLGRASVIEEIE